MTQRFSEREEKLLERIIETDGIKKIQDAITAVISGTPDVNVIDRAARLLGIIYGDVGQLLQRSVSRDLLVQLRSAGIEIDPRDVTDRAARLLGRVYGSQGQQLLQRATSPYALITSPEQTRTYADFSITASGEIIATPGAGKKLRIFDVMWSSNAAIVTSLRFGSGGTDMWPLQAAGVMSKNLVGRERDGAENTNLYGYLSGTGTMKGTVGYETVSV